MEVSNHPIFGEVKQSEVTFYFEDRQLTARIGQTVAAALMRNGIRKFGVSRKMNQSRGLFCANGRCCSCFMTVNGQEHVRTCMTTIEKGMRIKRNLGDPDVRRVIDAE